MKITLSGQIFKIFFSAYNLLWYLKSLYLSASWIIQYSWINKDSLMNKMNKLGNSIEFTLRNTLNAVAALSLILTA